MVFLFHTCSYQAAVGAWSCGAEAAQLQDLLGHVVYWCWFRRVSPWTAQKCNQKTVAWPNGEHNRKFNTRLVCHIPSNPQVFKRHLKLVIYLELLIQWCVKVWDPDWLHHWPCLWDWQECPKVACACSAVYFDLCQFLISQPLKMYKRRVVNYFCFPKQCLCLLRLLAANYPGRCIFQDILQFVRDASVPRMEMHLEAWFCSKCFVTY